MSEAYDVESEIKVDASAARGATERLVSDLLELQRTLLNTGSVMLSVFKGVAPQLNMFSTALLSASGHMATLKSTSGAVAANIAPLAKTIQQTSISVTTLGRQSRQAGDSMTSAFQRAGRAAGPLSGVLRNAIGIGAAYLGVRALTGAFTGLVRSSFAFGSTMERNRTSLGAVLAATLPSLKVVEDATQRMAQGGRIGDAIFRQLQVDALKSVATSAELATIYTQITGPLATAGARLSDIRKITNDTVAAATVLGVDYAQAARDINLMSTGSAGMDTMLFRMLKSTGRITESTKEWNEMLPAKRLKRMQEALSGFAPAAAAFEQTLPGITSSFVDYAQRFRQVFMSGPLEALRGLLVRLVDTFRQNETKISSVLKVLGDRFAGLLNPVVSGFKRVADYFIQNWESIANRIERTYTLLASAATHYGPSLMAGAKAAGGAALVGRYAPGAASAGFAGLKAGISGGGAAVEGSAFGTAISGITHLITSVSAMGGLFTYVVPVIAILVGLVAVLADQWQYTSIILGVVWGFLQQVFSTIWNLLTSVYGALMPLLKIIGVVVAAIMTLGLILGFFVVRILWGLFLKPMMDGWALIFEYLGQGLTWVYDKIVGMFTSLASLFGMINQDLLPQGAGGAGGISWVDNLKGQFAHAFKGFEDQAKVDDSILGKAEAQPPTSGKGTVNDFRNSKIEVKQDFRQADPDRVWAQFVQGIGDAASQRLSSALIPSGTR